MGVKLHLIHVICLIFVIPAATEGSMLMSRTSLKAMQTVFYRPEHVHQASMAAITESLPTPLSALKALQEHNLATPVLIEITHNLHAKRAHLRAGQEFSGTDGARKLLNDMIYESMKKYDAEIAKCTEYYGEQCAAMEACRGQISASNYIAANSRSLVLDAQGTINQCEQDIPTKKLQLKQHLLKCKHELGSMRARLQIVQGDIKVLSAILKMTDCDKKLVQMDKLSLLHCQDPCTQKSFVTFKEDSLKQQVSQLQSSVSHDLMKDSFKDLFEGIRSLETDILHVDMQNTTKFNNPPAPKTQVPGPPCNDPSGGAPTAANKRAAKCTISKSPQCYKLQERFLLIQSGVKDERDNLLEEIASMEKSCEDTKGTIETQVQNDQNNLGESQTKLGVATTKEANAGEEARQTAKEQEQLNGDLMKQMKTCSGNYVNFETELCALKKIRGEVHKMSKSAKAASFQDCVVSKWDPEECTKRCNGGQQKLTRNVMTHPNGGAKCLPLAALKKCNLQPCPTDCRLETWSGWSKCSAECGGGVRQRLREVKRAMKFGGKPCGQTSETIACNNQACEKDCELYPWTRWSSCSKDCDGGTQKRQKLVRHAPKGAGKCADKWSMKRLQYKKCNMHGCSVASSQKALQCTKKLDIVFLLDGSGSLGQKGWNAEIKAAQTFVDAFDGTGAKANMAVVLYSGPRTWGGVYKCFGRNRRKVDMEKTCKIQTVTHFTSDMKKVKGLITGLSWPKGSTLTSLALLRAASELSLGRRDAKSVVVVITDGRPLSYRATYYASRYVRKQARLVWVPVTRYAPLRKIKQWATRRWQENVVRVKSFKDLEKPDLVTHIVANICPKNSPKMTFKRR